jgi:hypothetical protein
MTAHPAGDPGSYEVIHLGGETAAIVPLGDLRQLQAVQRHASPELWRKPRSKPRWRRTGSGWRPGAPGPSRMKRRWLSCSASSEDRVVSGGAGFGAALHGGPGRDARDRRGGGGLARGTRLSR